MMNRARTMRHRGPEMGARHKLNQSFATGSLFFATFIGLAYSSWIAFGVSWGILLALNFLGGNIRLAGYRA